jgi:hypothetical protein
MKPLLYIGTPLLFMALFLLAVMAGWDMQDRSDCLKWAAQADAIPGVYWLTQAQKDQCDYWHVKVKGTVK